MRIISVYLLWIATLTRIGAAETNDLQSAIVQGKLSFNARLRFESVEQSGLRDGEAFTLRNRLGFATAPLHGWKALVEAENLLAADGDAYSQAGTNPGGAGRAVIADAEITELNQLFIAFTREQTTATLGRQRVVLDQARFVGDVGWRQNMQTFDALVLQDKSFAKTTLTYAYLDRIHRVFGRNHPQGRWDSDSHLLNAGYSGLPGGTLAVYAYLLDFANSPVNSCATYGASYTGAHAFNKDLKFNYRLEAATQADEGSSPLNYSTHYASIEAGLAGKTAGLSLGHEVLGSDRNVGFKTPLATLHAFNGWADLFLTTPAAGLRDTYAKATLTLPANVSILAFYHRFSTESGGTTLGDEFDLQVSRKFSQRFTALAKYADFNRSSPTLPDVRKFWLQMEFAH